MTHQLEKERKYAKLELGNFCEQFGYSPLKTIAPSRQRRKQQNLYKNNYKNYNRNKKINTTNLIIANLTKILILDHKLKMLENKKIELLFVIDVVKPVISKRIAK